MRHPVVIGATSLCLCLFASSALAQAQVVPPAASGAISGPYSGTHPVNPAPSSLRDRGDVTDNRSTTPFGDARPARDDGAILGSIVSALASDPALQGAELQVEVDDGVVGITGHALDSAQAERAGRVAAQAANGARVETDIGVE
jgi:hypothetical protein